MTAKDSLRIGLVGSRAYEVQAWQSPGASAVEEAYWAAPVPARTVPPKSRLSRFLDCISASAVKLAIRH